MRARLSVVMAVAMFSSALAHAQCVSQLREASSGVFNRLPAAVAWSGTLLGVAKVDESGGRAISFATYSESLDQLTSDRTVAEASVAGPLALLWNGTEFALFYQNAGRVLLLQRISASGEPIGGPIGIATNHQAANDREYDVAWDPTRQAYVLVHSVFAGNDRGLWLTIVNRDGTTRSEQAITIFLTSPSSPRVAVNDHGTIAVLFRRNGVFNLQTVDASGVTGTIAAVMTANDVRIASNGTDFAVVGSVPVVKPTEIDWVKITESALIGAVRKLVSARGAEIAPVSLYWNATKAEWALAYLDSLFGFSQIAGDYRLRRFTDSGSLISDSPFSTDPLQTRLSTNEPFAWTGSSYITAASRAFTPSAQAESYLIRHCPLTANIRGLQFVREATPVTFTAAPEGGSGNTTYEWEFSDTGEIRTGPTVTHVYTHLGDFQVTLRATDDSGATSSTTIDVHVITPKRRAVKR